MVFVSGNAKPRSTDKRWNVREDCVPDDWLFRVEPSFNLAPPGVVEDAYDSRLDIHAITPCTHNAQGAHMLVATHHVMLVEPEPLVESTRVVYEPVSRALTG